LLNDSARDKSARRFTGCIAALYLSLFSGGLGYAAAEPVSTKASKSTPVPKNAPVSKSPAASKEVTVSNPIVQTLEEELKRAKKELSSNGNMPLYYLAYRLYEGNWETIDATDGALQDDKLKAWRMLAVDLRLGSPRFDNTHYLRSHRTSSPTFYERTASQDSILPINGSDIALRQSLWLKTDEAYKAAQERLTELRASNEIYSIEEDKSGDFSLQPPHHYDGKIKATAINRTAWQDELRRLSKVLLAHPQIDHSLVSLAVSPTTFYFVNSENSQIVEQHLNCNFYISGSELADDGMNLWLYDSIEVPEIQYLPDEAVLKQRIEKLANNLDELRKAPVAEPYVGPAILSGKAAAVFFHETFGHRVEAIHEKSETEGKTYARRLGELVMPKFISVEDDPTREKLGNHWLNGFYHFDDEGVPAQKVQLAKNGILTGFLVGRTPVQGFKESNGHGRSSPGWNPMGRQANLFVTADKSKQYDPATLRRMLINEAIKQHKTYGLLFDEISGGFTYTSRSSEQTYTVNPLRVYKVFVDGKPDELIRGASIVGTPLAALERIIAAGTDYQSFDGRCGRESGTVPVSAIAPSLLLQSIEIKRTSKTFEKPPILPDPTPHDVESTGGHSK